MNSVVVFVRMRKGKKREKTVQVCGKGKGKENVLCAYLEKEGNRVFLPCIRKIIGRGVFLWEGSKGGM